MSRAGNGSPKSAVPAPPQAAGPRREGRPQTAAGTGMFRSRPSGRWLASACAVIIFASRPAAAVENAGRAAPSEIERHVSRAIAFAYLQRPREMDKEYLYLKGLDDFLKEQGKPSTGLSDRVLDLYMSSLNGWNAPSRWEPDSAFGVADAEDAALRDEKKQLAEADSLILTDRYNRFAFIFNTFVRPLSLLAVGYFPALIDAGVATALNAPKLTELSVEEKKALALYKEFLDKYPDSDSAKLLQQRATALDRKRIKHCHDSELQMAENNLARNEFWQAQQHFKNALAYIPTSSRASSGLAKARELEHERNLLREKTLEPPPALEKSVCGAEERDYQELLYRSSAGDPKSIISAAESFISRHPDSPMAADAMYAGASAHDSMGEHEKAKEIMRRIASRYRRTHIGRHAAAYLSDPNYNLEMVFHDSQYRHIAETARYVTLGPDFVKSNVILGTSRIVTQGLQAFGSLGTFNVLALFIRAANSLMHNPVSDQEVIDSGINYLRRYPDAPDAPGIHLALARAYAARKNFSKAIYHLQAGGEVSESKLDSYRAKAARQCLDLADATDNREEKIRCYERILDEYPSTSASARAIDALSMLEKSEKPIFRIDKNTLAENPVIFKLAALHIGPHLLDGDSKNGELASGGVYSRKRGNITLVYRDGGGEREESFDVDSPTYSGLKAFAEEAEYRKIVSDSGDKTALKFPVELRGTVGDAGVFVYPRLKIREYQEKDLYLYK